MKLFENIREALKLAKKIKEVKKYLNDTHLTKDVKDDLIVIKEAFKRIENKIPAAKGLFDLIF